jgi:E3 ubiquitin-protein ligase UBR4
MPPSFSASDREVLLCPRCTKIVDDKHGNCPSCGDNAFQCTFCRNINYEKLDAFICNECGLSRYGKFDITLAIKPGFAIESIDNEANKKQVENSIDTNLQNAQN